MAIKEILPAIKENVSLKKYTTFKIGGTARYFCFVYNKEELLKVIKWAQRNKIPFFILGKGSNILISDNGYQGLVIRLENKEFKIKNKRIIAGAGLSLNELVKKSAANELEGLEWAAGIPGSLGGAVYGNAGAFGRSTGDLIEKVETLEIKKKAPKIKIFSKKECQFGYRKSIFKKNKNLIILSAVLRLKKGSKKVINERIKKYLEYRKKNQPLNLPSAGSVFKNPKNFSAGELIEKCGLKGKRIGNVKFSEKHANFIVNLGKGRAKEVKKLIELAKKKVKKRFGIDLKEEIQYL